jgi:murein DD-endopeptidase MepM/ murein hydrolase activator NlpD
MPIRLTLFILSLLLLSQNLFAKEYRWKHKMTFLSLLNKYHIPQKLYYGMDREDKELIQEIHAGQSYTINWKKGKIDTINIPVSDALMLQIRKKKKNYIYKYIPIPFDLIEKTIFIKIKKGLDRDLYKATKTHYYTKEIQEVYSKALPLKKMKKGDKIIIFYTQKFRHRKPLSSPQIEACMIEINKKPYYGYLMDDEKYYDSLGIKYKRTYSTRFIRPVPNFKRVSSGFTKSRYHPILHRYRAHLGIDYAARSGSRIVASSSGKVVFRGWKGGYGRVVEVKHRGGLKTLYAHMSRFGRVKKGSYVKQGQTIGYVGTSGRSTGPHLHFGLYKNNRPVNPARYVRKQQSKKVKLKGKAYRKLRKHVLHYRPQFREVKKRHDSIIKVESKKCLHCLKRLPKRKRK